MIITVLVDNNTYIDQYYLGEPALSFYIEHEDQKILFDTGYSDAFLRNSDYLGIDLSKVSTIIFSHGHNDHTRGMTYLKKNFFSRKVQIIAHPDVFQNRFENSKSIGSPFSVESLPKESELTLSRKAVFINSRLTFLGEIPCYFDFEPRKAVGVLKSNGKESPDFVLDDTALAYNTGKGLFIITGCSHSGICNIIEHAKHVFNEEKVAGVIGGFHLFDVSVQLMNTIKYFRENQIKKLYPCHCVSFAAKSEIHKSIPVNEVGVGLKIEF